ncbi:hypothetical protein Q3G72_029742 [Acer saccharum]|nr:hypothetical protein Q3G72_029742 [Acer saccharum]
MCWKVVAKTVDASGIGLVIYQKPVSYSCYKQRKDNYPPLCEWKHRGRRLRVLHNPSAMQLFKDAAVDAAPGS